jgi:hypothetical protein
MALFVAGQVELQPLLSCILPAKGELTMSLFERVVSLILRADSDATVESVVRACATKPGKETSHRFLQLLCDAVFADYNDAKRALLRFPKQLAVSFLLDASPAVRLWAYSAIQRLFADGNTNRFPKTPSPVAVTWIRRFAIAAIDVLSSALPELPRLLAVTAPLRKTDSPLWHFVKVGRWACSATNDYGEAAFRAVLALLDAIGSSPTDYNAAITAAGSSSFGELAHVHFTRLHAALMESVAGAADHVA